MDRTRTTPAAQPTPGQPSSPRRLAVSPATVIVFALAFSPALFVASILVWNGQQLPEAAGLVALYAAALAWMCGQSVELAPGKLVYRTLFVRRTYELSSVRGARVVSRPAPRLELRTGEARRFVPTFILKPFTREGVAAILRHVEACGQQVALDPIAAELAAGRFDALTRETLRARSLLRAALVVAGAILAALIARRLWS